MSSKNTNAKQASNNPDKIYWILLGILLFIVAIIRLRIINVPLERDEGEYAYMGKLILKGIFPYDIAYNMKFPGTYYMYAFFMMIFGQTITGIHLGLLIINLISIFFIFLIVKKLVDNIAAISASAVYAILSVSSGILGFAAHATHFVVVCALAGFWFLIKTFDNENRKNFLLSGIMLGFAPIMKQQGIILSFFGFVFLAIQLLTNGSFKKGLVNLLIFTGGGLIPLLLMLISILITGTFHKFWFWAVDYAMKYENLVSFDDAIQMFKDSIGLITDGFLLIWIIALAGLFFMFKHPVLNIKTKTFLLMLFIFLFLSVCPGLYFRTHYFIVFLPAIAVFFGITISYFHQKKISAKFKYWKQLSFILLIIPLLYSFSIQYNYFFKLQPSEISKMVYVENPFVESLNIARYIKNNSVENDKIAILGSEPEVCFYADRISASGYLYTYSLMENQANSLIMQKEMAKEIETALPKYFLLYHVKTSWFAHTDSEQFILNWIKPFLQNNKYQLKGIVDMCPEGTVYKWDEEVRGYRPVSSNYIVIYTLGN
jgi:4-amino-4-deoxy-L-arabinose transferase-like glycosyltransferase